MEGIRAAGRRPFIGAEWLDALKDRKLAAQPGKDKSFPGLPSDERSKGDLRSLYREFYPDEAASDFTLKFAFQPVQNFDTSSLWFVPSALGGCNQAFEAMEIQVLRFHNFYRSSSSSISTKCR